MSANSKFGAQIKLYSIYEVAEILGIKNGRIREWISRGYIKPYKEATGRGSKHLLSKRDIFKIKLFEYLLNRGISRKEAHKAIVFAPEPKENQHLILIKSDDDLVAGGAVVENGRFQLGLSENYDDVLIVNVRKIEKHVEALII